MKMNETYFLFVNGQLQENRNLTHKYNLTMEHLHGVLIQLDSLEAMWKEPFSVMVEQSLFLLSSSSQIVS